MTFLIDPPLLIIFSLLSCWIDEKAKGKTERPVEKFLAIFSLCVIIFTSSSLYLNMWFMDWFWMPFSPGVTSGRDLMINSGLFAFESVNTGGLIDTLALIQILLYPLWSIIGLRLWNRIRKESK
jgi:hypothetical protein